MKNVFRFIFALLCFFISIVVTPFGTLFLCNNVLAPLGLLETEGSKFLATACMMFFGFICLTMWFIAGCVQIDEIMNSIKEKGQ